VNKKVEKDKEDLTKTATGFTPSFIEPEKELSCLFCGTQLNRNSDGVILPCLNCRYPHFSDEGFE
jgi:hypothetical protein